MPYKTFCVGSRAFRYWSPHPDEDNRLFLESIDPDYYRYIGSTHHQHLTSDEFRHRASVALRSALHHGAETLVTLIGAFIQAPDCAVGYFLKCQNPQIDEVAAALNDRRQLPGVPEPMGWKDVARQLFSSADDRELADSAINGYSRVWQAIGSDVCDKDLRDEYNSIKHGGRVRAGGWSIEIGSGDLANEPTWHSFMQSQFGSTFYVAQKVKGHACHMAVSETSLSWDTEVIRYQLDFCSASIKNLLTILLARYSDAPVQLFVPTLNESDAYAKAARSITANKQRTSFRLPEVPASDLLSRKELQKQCLQTTPTK